MLSIGASVDRLDLWGVMLFAAEVDIIVACVEYSISVFMIMMFSSLNAVSEIKSDDRPES